ncbi:MAG: trehalase family glycosidase [Neisseria sp.]|nr:trehalase family glycosidase [Neisseria sp.]
MRINKTDTLKALLAQEDTDGSRTITVEDQGPKSFTVIGDNGDTLAVNGTYHLANLLQEIWLGQGEINPANITQPPLERIDYLMRTHYWRTLTRRMDADNVLAVLFDEKRSSDKGYLYVPAADSDGLEYYRRITATHANIEVVPLPAPPLSAEYLQSIEHKPGLLALKYDAESGQPLPYVVPGGRFNEMYGWDSYFIALGLLQHGEYELAQGMLENMAYQIKYYGKMLNANRSYYLTRSQPPFYTPYLAAFMAACGGRVSREWLAEHLAIAIAEYETVWMNPATRLTPIGLNRYFGEGKGRPKETEPGHFDFELQKYADKHGIDVREFEKQYDEGRIIEPELDRYFVHDRSMRESGHDTTTRFDNVCADLACVDVNSILYRVETDIATLIEQYFDGSFDCQGKSHGSADWREQAAKRRALMQQYLWNEADGSFYDYNVATSAQQPFLSATNLLPLWAGCCTQAQAEKLVQTQLPKLLQTGGIMSAQVCSDAPGPERQWDGPYGWAPHQILIWEGLQRYGFEAEAQQAAFAWLQMIVRAAVEYNGLITEKFNVQKASHKVDAEYGNVGAAFEYVPAGGFGWTNASFLLGLHYLDEAQKAALNRLGEAD